MKSFSVNDTKDVKIDVYYKEEKSFKSHAIPSEVVVTYPEKYGISPVKLSGSLISLYGVKDKTEDFLLNKSVKENKDKVRMASIDLLGVVNYHVGEPNYDV